MPISQKNKIIFVHVPKCAGSSIEYHFEMIKPGKVFYPEIIFGWQNNSWSQHWSFEQIIKECKKLNINTDDFFSFSVVRNPWDRLVSSFFWRKTNPKFSMEFKEFVKHFRFNNRVHFKPQHEFIIDKNGNQMVDFVCRYENLQEDFNFLCCKIGQEPKNLCRANKTNHKNYTEYYDNETIDIVSEKYAKDIEYFNYKFGE